MQPWRGAILTALLCMAGTGPARAGLYNPAEPDEGPLVGNAAHVDKFRSTLTTLVSIALPRVEVDNPLRRRYLLLETMARDRPVAGLALEQKLTLSATFLR